MKFKNYILAGLTALSLGMVAGTSPAKASYFIYKSVYYHMPASWRGTYYNSYGDTMKVNKYSISFNGKTSLKSSWSGWRKLAFAKVGKKYYTLNAYATMGANSSRRWKLFHKNGNTYLYHIGAMDSRTTWKKYVKHKKVTSNLFHGYKLATKNEKYNTIFMSYGYYSFINSRFKPTDFDNVRFKRDQHCIPTKWEWDYFPNDSYTEITYRYNETTKKWEDFGESSYRPDNAIRSDGFPVPFDYEY